MVYDSFLQQDSAVIYVHRMWDTGPPARLLCFGAFPSPTLRLRASNNPDGQFKLTVMK